MIAALMMMAAATAAPPACVRKAVPATVSPDAASVRHVVQNGYPVPLQLWWIDPRGDRRLLQGTMAPGAFLSFTTWVGHTFVAADAEARCRRTVTVDGVTTGSFVGTSRYRPIAVDGGWHVNVDRALDPEELPASLALAVLAGRLAEVAEVLPPRALAQVRATPIFLHRGAGIRASYHPDPGWLVAHGRTVELTAAIEIPDAEAFVATVPGQPGIVLHELAHSYHAKMSEADRAAVEAAYRGALAAGRYRRIQRVDGTVVDAYALTSAEEYFAELTEAWFGRNDYFPFTRADLSAHDPEGARLMARAWR